MGLVWETRDHVVQIGATAPLLSYPPPVMGPHMSARSHTRGESAVVSVSGEIDVATAPELSRVIDRAVAGSTGPLVVDLLDVSFMDSSGLAVLVGVKQRNPDLQITLVTGSGMVQRLIETVALDRMFRITRTVSEAAP